MSNKTKTGLNRIIIMGERRLGERGLGEKELGERRMGERRGHLKGLRKWIKADDDRTKYSFKGFWIPFW